MKDERNRVDNKPTSLFLQTATECIGSELGRARKGVTQGVRWTLRLLRPESRACARFGASANGDGSREPAVCGPPSAGSSLGCSRLTTECCFLFAVPGASLLVWLSFLCLVV